MIHSPLYSCTMNYTVFGDCSPGSLPNTLNDANLAFLNDKICFLISPVCHTNGTKKIFLQMDM